MSGATLSKSWDAAELVPGPRVSDNTIAIGDERADAGVDSLPLTPPRGLRITAIGRPVGDSWAPVGAVVSPAVRTI